MVVAADPGSIACQWVPTNTRYEPAEGCGKVHTTVSRFSVFAIFRILPNLSYSPDQGRIRCHRGDYIFAAILWPWAVDYIRASSWDVVGVAVALLGMGIIAFQPR